MNFTGSYLQVPGTKKEIHQEIQPVYGYLRGTDPLSGGIIHASTKVLGFLLNSENCRDVLWNHDALAESEGINI